MQMDIKAVIFDLDGTLIDSIEDIADANNKMLESYGFPKHEFKDYVKWIGNGAKRLVEFSLPSDVRGGDIMEYLKKYLEFYQQNTCSKSKIYKGMDKVLDLLTENNIPFAIYTNKPQSLADLVVDYYLKKWPFKCVIGHSNAFPHKPDPKGALHFAKQINCNPKNILLVGDSVVDVQTAKAAGMIPLGVSWGYGEPGMEDPLVRVVKDHTEIMDLLGIQIKV